MSEPPGPAGLPERPNLDQLRHQARELQRAAAAGEARALRRLGAVSAEATLSGAQLAVARELGFPSWARLKQEVERRRRAAAPAGRWSFGGAQPLSLELGVLSPSVLLVDDDQALLEGGFVPSRPIRAGRPRGWQRLVMQVPLAPRLFGLGPRAPLPRLSGLHATDDRGARYGVRPRRAAGTSRREGRNQVLERMQVVLSLDPLPPRGVRWLEVRDETGAASRLLPARQATVVAVGADAPPPGGGRGFDDLSTYDIGAELTFADGPRVRVDCLVPGVEGWRLCLRVWPRWWRTHDDKAEHVPVLEVVAEDDLGGRYTTRPAHSWRGGEWEDVTLELRPGLDLGARRLVLRFAGTRQQLAIAVEPGA